MGEIFLSTGAVVGEGIQVMEALQNLFKNTYTVGGYRTNLSVISNCQDAIQNIYETDDEYKKLLSKDATAMSDINDTYINFDKTLSDCMSTKITFPLGGAHAE